MKTLLTTLILSSIAPIANTTAIVEKPTFSSMFRTHDLSQYKFINPHVDANFILCWSLMTGRQIQYIYDHASYYVDDTLYQYAQDALETTMLSDSPVFNNFVTPVFDCIPEYSLVFSLLSCVYLHIVDETTYEISFRNIQAGDSDFAKESIAAWKSTGLVLDSFLLVG